MLAATLIFIFGPRFTKTISSKSNPGGSGNIRLDDYPSRNRIIAACCLQLLVAVYGGYFGGGMGFVILAMLSAFGMADIHEMNAFKVVLSSAINGLAVIVFIVLRAVYWRQALVMICGAALGGYFGARYSLRLPQKQVRWAVIAIGASMTAYFFVRAY
jgi:Predicted permeases